MAALRQRPGRTAILATQTLTILERREFSPSGRRDCRADAIVGVQDSSSEGPRSSRSNRMKSKMVESLEGSPVHPQQTGFSHSPNWPAFWFYKRQCQEEYLPLELPTEGARRGR